MSVKNDGISGSVQRACIISIGAELMLGQCIDTNAAWLASELASLGIRCERHVTIGDDMKAIRDAVRSAAGAADAVLITGGLGPTADDLTRQALAAAAEVELVADADSLECIRAFFESRGRAFPEQNSVQAMIPSGATAIENTCGTAPGIFVEIGGAACFAMPGVPFEMKAMFRRNVLPRLQTGGGVLRSRILNCFGLGESVVGEKLSDLMIPGQNPAVGTTAGLGVISVRINASAKTSEQVDKMLDQAEAEVRRRLGRLVFGRDGDTLATVLGASLSARGETLSTAESCTGGLIAKLLTDTPGSSRYFVGSAVTYSNDLKQQLLGVTDKSLSEFGAVSEQTAREMACGARERFQSTYALATTGIAGPTGGTPDKPVGLVYIAVAAPGAADVYEYRWSSEYPREVIRLFTAHTALNRLRLRFVD